MNYRHLDNCPICGCNRLRHWTDCTDFLATGESFSILECSDCGMKMTQDVPVEAEIGRYYQAPEYISHSDTREGLMNRLYHAVRSYMLGRKARLVEKACGRKNGRLLDIGCGTGYFAHTMQDRGWTVEAIEKSSDARAFAQQQFRLSVHDESRTDGFGAHSFDAVTLWHVMEHIENLPALWSALKRQLKDDGRLVVAVPNCASHDAQHYGNGWAAFDVPRHLWHFNHRTLPKLAEQSGFEPCRILPMPFDAFYIAMLSEKNRGSKLFFLKGCWVGFITGCLTLFGVHHSSSLIFVFRKKQ